MRLPNFIFIGALALAGFLSLPASAQMADHAASDAHIMVGDSGLVIAQAYARSSRPNAPTGAIFLQIVNEGDTPDRLIDAQSTIAQRVELHTHIADENGVMKMRQVVQGFPVAAGDTHMLARGGDHIMLMGLTESLETGMSFPLTLVFENAGPVQFDVTVDLERQPDAMQHGMKMGN